MKLEIATAVLALTFVAASREPVLQILVGTALAVLLGAWWLGRVLGGPDDSR